MLPIIGLSDQTQFTFFSGDHKAWPVYVTISNIRSLTRNSPIKRPILVLAFMPLPPTLKDDSGHAEAAQRQTNPDTLRAVFHLDLSLLEEVVHEGTVMDYADCKTCLSFPFMAARIADCAEHPAFHEISSKSCPKCAVPLQELGGNPRKIHEARHYTLY